MGSALRSDKFVAVKSIGQTAAVCFLFCAALLFNTNSVTAFDTFWHSAASAAAGREYGFSADAVSALQFGTFGPDFFGPLYDAVLGQRVEKASAEMEKLFDLRDAPGVAPVRKAGIFMHFDNLHDKVKHNWQFDYIWMRLLENTGNAIYAYNSNTSLNEGTRKSLILLTLGASLHMVEDFYSHSDWCHMDFVKAGFPQKQTTWGKDYAPTWFEVKAQLGDPVIDSSSENWPFRVSSGIYPDPTPGSAIPKTMFGVPMLHTNMNHDNSQLFYEDASQIKYHNLGAHPATDVASAAEHQLYAVNTAAMAAIEWVKMLETKRGVKEAIEYAKGWDIKAYNFAMLNDLSSGLEFALLASCMKHKWDGDNPPASRVAPCSVRSMVSSFNLPTEFNEWWGAFVRYNILEKLTVGIGDQSGQYTFDKDWLKSARTN